MIPLCGRISFFVVELSYDLHIHSCLSPCGDGEMLPSDIVGMAYVKGLDVIAVTDHNSCKNCPAVLKKAEEYGLTAIPGMELCTAEEVHVLCLFPELEAALAFDERVRCTLPAIKNRPDIFGEQLIVDENDRVIGSEPYLLISAASIPFDAVYAQTAELGGIMIPAHIDKGSNSLLSNLGFIPPDSRFSCAELRSPAKAEELRSRHPYLQGCRLITNSDAHRLEEIHEPVNFLSADSRDPADILRALIIK